MNLLLKIGIALIVAVLIVLSLPGLLFERVTGRN